MIRQSDPPRTYASSLRAQQAASTRNRVIEAAGQLFGERGYARTTLAVIAATAGVSIETVQAQGPKRALLGPALLQATLGHDGHVAILQTPEARAVAGASTPEEFSAAVAELMTQFNTRTAGIWRVFSSAAADDPAVDEEWSAVMRGVRGDVTDVVDMAISQGWTRTDVDTEELVAGAWILIGSDVFEKLTTRLGWSTSRYQTWLARSIADLLFP